MSDNLKSLSLMPADKLSHIKPKNSFPKSSNKENNFSDILQNIKPKKLSLGKNISSLKQTASLQDKAPTPADKPQAIAPKNIPQKNEPTSEKISSEEVVSENEDVVASEVKEILGDESLSLEEKIAALLENEEFATKPTEEKKIILSKIFEENPEIKEEISDEIEELSAHEEVPKDTPKLEEKIDDENKEDKTQNDLINIIATVIEAPLSPKQIHADTSETEDIQALTFETKRPLEGEPLVDMNAHNQEIENPNQPQQKQTKTEQPTKEIFSEVKSESQSEQPIKETKKEISEETPILQKIETKSNQATEKPIAPTTQKELVIEAPKENNVQAQQPILTHAQQTIHNVKEVNQLISHSIPLENNVSLIVTRHKDTPEKIGINLEPAGMGEAELIIENKDNAVVAIVRSEKPETLDMIRKESASLEKYLQESGLNLSGGGLQFERKSQDDSSSQSRENSKIQSVSLSNNQSSNYVKNEMTVYQKLDAINLRQGMDVRL